jgi:Protein of unknown function (DUF2384)
MWLSHEIAAMESNALAQPDPRRVLAAALASAGRELGLNQQELGLVVGRDRTALSRGGLDPGSKSGELALLLIRAYRALFALTGGDRDAMRHWFQTENLHTGGVPARQVLGVQGLVQVVEYLDAIRGRL